MNRKRLIVVLESEIYIYDISTMKLLHTIETGPNPNGESIKGCFTFLLTPQPSVLSHQTRSVHIWHIPPLQQRLPAPLYLLPQPHHRRRLRQAMYTCSTQYLSPRSTSYKPTKLP